MAKIVKFGILFLGIIAVLILSAGSVSAHRSGCHRWHSCPSDSGSYSCGDWGYSNYCSTTYSPPPTITTKDEAGTSDIPFETKTTSNPNEYVGYRELTTPGIKGVAETHTSVSYSNGVETSRGDPSTTTTTQPVNEVFSIGTRMKPTAYIDYIMAGKQKQFLWFKTDTFDVYASADANKKFALMRNESVISLGSSDNKGSLVFKQVEFNEQDTLSIATYSGDKFLWIMPSGTRISEKNSVNIKNLTLLTEYDKLHNKTETPPRDAAAEKNECSETVKKTYLDSRTAADKVLDDASGSVTIHYPDPCVIKFST